MDRTTEAISTYAGSLDYSDLTPAAIHACKVRVIDALGCAVGGYAGEPSRIAQRLAATYSSSLQSSVLVSGVRTSPDMAAFANAVMVRHLDFNDVSAPAGRGGHPSDMLSTILALAEPVHATGRDVILAIVAAYEINGAFAHAISFQERGWDQGTIMVVGGTVGAGKILGLPEWQLSQAISLAVTSNVATRQTRAGQLSMWKGCATAATARNSVFAALLAREGMTAPEEPFEGRHGVWEQVTGPFQLHLSREGGGPFQVEVTSLKLFPAEFHCQALISLALEIRRELPLEDIGAIHVRTYRHAYRETGSEPEKWDPQTRETADHSLPYLLAVALTDGEVNLSSFSSVRIRDPQLRPLMNKITVAEEDDFTRAFPDVMMSEIDVTTLSGARLVKRATPAKGHVLNPLTDADVEAKFRALCQGSWPTEQSNAILRTLWELDAVADVGSVLDLMQTRTVGA